MLRSGLMSLFCRTDWDQLGQSSRWRTSFKDPPAVSSLLALALLILRAGDLLEDIGIRWGEQQNLTMYHCLGNQGSVGTTLTLLLARLFTVCCSNQRTWGGEAAL